MWGREMRAGLLFVLVSVALGGAFRGWERAHRERFDETVASLVDASAREEDPSSGVASPGAAATAGAAESGHAALPGAALPASPGGPRRGAAEAPLPASIDVDRASVDEFLRLPGFGPALAARIGAERERQGPFGGPDGLLRVRGIGPKTLEKIRPYLARSSP